MEQELIKKKQESEANKVQKAKQEARQLQESQANAIAKEEIENLKVAFKENQVRQAQ